MKLWVDDLRAMPWDSNVLWHIHAKTSSEAIDWMKSWSCNNADRGRPVGANIEEVSLDHDLGGDDTGFKVLDWMIDHQVWPQVLTIHTSNRPARERMLAAANAEAPEWVNIFVIYDHLDN